MLGRTPAHPDQSKRIRHLVAERGMDGVGGCGNRKSKIDSQHTSAWINEPDDEGMTPLHLAARAGHVEVVP